MDDDCVICRAQRGEMVYAGEGWQTLGLEGVTVTGATAGPALTLTLSNGQSLPIEGLFLLGGSGGAVEGIGELTDARVFVPLIGQSITLALIADDGGRVYRFGERTQLIIPQQVTSASLEAFRDRGYRRRRPKSRYKFS